MKITALVENTSHGFLTPAHGLALYIETAKHKMLFDVGPEGELLFRNAEKMQIDLSAVDTVVISHGHYDHGGALGDFLRGNSQARVYLQEDAFLPHYRVIPGEEPKYNGIDGNLANHPRVTLLRGDYEIDEELMLFTISPEMQKCRSEANVVLYEQDAPDRFCHEQNLLIRGEHNVLIMGCGHAGIVNILEKAAPMHPQICIGGYHLKNPTTGRAVSMGQLSQIADFLKRYPEMRFYTCHCTGNVAYTYLAERMGNMAYFACGDRMEV